MTGAHVKAPMAIVLDGQVYSAPTLQTQINGSGTITGNYSQSDIQYLIKVLAAGSLEARLSHDPIAVNIIGPTLGIDNLSRGLTALGWVGDCGYRLHVVLLHGSGTNCRFCIACKRHSNLWHHGFDRRYIYLAWLGWCCIDHGYGCRRERTYL